MLKWRHLVSTSTNLYRYIHSFCLVKVFLLNKVTTNKKFIEYNRNRCNVPKTKSFVIICSCWVSSVTGVLCGKPADGVNTVPVCASTSMSFMDVYEYRCLTGYSTLNKLASVCQADGTFSISPPVCTLVGKRSLLKTSMLTILYKSYLLPGLWDV